MNYERCRKLRDSEFNDSELKVLLLSNLIGISFRYGDQLPTKTELCISTNDLCLYHPGEILNAMDEVLEKLGYELFSLVNDYNKIIFSIH